MRSKARMYNLRPLAPAVPASSFTGGSVEIRSDNSLRSSIGWGRKLRIVFDALAGIRIRLG
ncbi:hypothetical protein PanWU01x14_302330 [Parasponia andersonii]|uniref:Uncharacterized protein n=1 Tax=Parasponia andersonii TaxID=3476 RepID=A0A2P5ATD5_PARAD|nr:hypothetical protein PanWU01x14_302330 [Parasponia andersonii]